MTEPQVFFRPWPKTQRITKGLVFEVTVTEKIDGTNSCVIIEQGELVGCQSRNRLITPDNDNMGFARWAYDNKPQLEMLGDGYHYGEWAGPGIQKNRHKLDRKTFFLFNTYKWNEETLPKCCSVVPVITTYFPYEDHLVPVWMKLLKEDRDYEPEGICLYFPFFGQVVKHTYENPEGKWKG